MSNARLVAAAGKLKSVKRQGWLDAGIRHDEAESVADHSFRVAFMAAFLAPSAVPARPAPARGIRTQAGLDVLRLVKMSLVHDLAESEIGDLTPRSGVPKRSKANMERRAIRALGNNEVLELWEEYEEGRTPEARLARELDVLERVIQARDYAAGHPGARLTRFWRGDVKRIRSIGLRALLAEGARAATE